MKATIQTAITTIKAFSKAEAGATNAILKMLMEIKAPEDYKATRAEFVKGYGKGGDDAWERQVLKTAKAHDWKKPQSTEAARKATTRAKNPKALKTGTTPAKATNVKGMKVAGKVLTLTMPSKAQADDLQTALSWVMSDDTHKALFISWVSAHQANTRQVKAA